MLSYLVEAGGPAILVLIGAIIAAVGGIWGSVQQTQDANEMRAKTEEIANLNRRLADLVTGGDSFCYLSPTQVDSPDHLPILALVHSGASPLYDVSVDLVDLQKASAVPDQASFEGMLSARTVIQMGNLAVGQSKAIGRLDVPVVAKKYSYNVFISARNGMFTELIRTVRVNGVIRSAVQVHRQIGNSPSEVVFERVDDGFPRAPNGQVDWS